MAKRRKPLKAPEHVWRLNAGEHEPSRQDRRRAQVRHAQKAYRQRREDMLTNLGAQVKHLEKIIEKLNTSFLVFSDTLVASGVLEENTQLANALAKTTRDFVSLANGDSITSSEDDAGASAFVDTSVPPSECETQSDSVSEALALRNTIVLDFKSNNSSPRAILGQFCTEEAWKDTIGRQHLPTVYQEIGVEAQADVLANIIGPMESYPASSESSIVPALSSLIAEECSFEYQLTYVTCIRALSFLKHTHIHDEKFRRVFQENLPPHTPESMHRHFEESFLLLRRFGTLPLRRRHEERVRRQSCRFVHQQMWPSSIREVDEWFDAIDVTEYLKGKGIDLDQRSAVVALDLNEAAMAYICEARKRFAKNHLPTNSTAPSSQLDFILFDDDMALQPSDQVRRGAGRMIVNITKLIDELVYCTRSLGNLPGVRRTDVDRAIGLSVWPEDK